MYVIVAYDIPDDKKREQIADVLLGYGLRVQKSVFECDVKPEHLSQMKHRLTEMIDPKEDSLCFYYLCSACELKAERQGEAKKRYEQTRSLII